MVLFTKDPSVLLGQGNAGLIDFSSSESTANTLARMIIYVSIIIALCMNKPKIILIGLLVIVILGMYYSKPMMEQYMDRWKKPVALKQVYNLKDGNSKKDRMRQYKRSLLTNVRERPIYLGEEYGVPSAEEFMLGGTRPLSWDYSEAVVDDLFGKNVEAPVLYEGVRARHTGAPNSSAIVS